MFFWTWPQSWLEKRRATGLENKFWQMLFCGKQHQMHRIRSNAETVHGKNLQCSPSCKRILKFWNIRSSCKNRQICELSEKDI